jgi:hypothetical protein
MPHETLVMVYCAYFHSIMNFVIIFGGNSHYNINFLGYKKVITIITGSKNKDVCCDMFRKFNVLTLQSQYIFSLLCFIIMSRDQYKLNSDILGRNRRQKF